jgi:hypothetical protein
MKKEMMIGLFVMFISLSMSAFSFQKEDTKKDSSDSGFFSEWSEFYGIRTLSKSEKSPSLDFYWGTSQPSFKIQNYQDRFSKIGDFSLKIGYSNISTKEFIVKYTNESVLLQGFSSNYYPSFEKKQNEIELKAWRAGIENASGYGYEFSDNFKLLLYNSNALIWTRLEFVDGSFTNDPLHIYDTYNESIRFGDKFEGGIKIQLFKPLGISAAYERSIVFPRHLFWYWLGSEAIELVGQSLVDGFVKAVIKSNSVAAPIVAFALKNGFSYVLYELRSEKMNWPFDTTVPLHFQSFKLGLSFMF